MPLPLELVRELRQEHRLVRAVETGTYLGDGARALRTVFDDVETVERSLRYYLKARRTLRGTGIKIRFGDSRRVLRPSTVPTLYWLDGHWSGGDTAGAQDECPVLDELAAIRSGHPHDVVLIDDARLFLAPPPPPHDPSQWPSVPEIEAALGAPVRVVGDVFVADS